jgi:type IV pilus assembly protein PilB
MPTQTLKQLYDDLRMAHSKEGGRGVASADDAFVVKLAQLILSYGVEVRASDAHIEPGAVGTRVRYRIDGILHEMLAVPPEISEPLIRSVKLKANMQTDMVGRSKPQDGRFDFEWAGRKLDMRLSSFPTLFGDVLTMRMLDRSAPLLPLEQLGFPQAMLVEFERLIQRPNGLILVTGPANSGKTTTLYGALNKLRSPRIKIITLEDPVEYQVDGIDQGQINPAVGLTFASGLRAILRQDANIILVGEMRDKETTDIAIRAALTGHLVLSTIHTRHSIGAISRLVDMGIEQHLILASVTGIIAQRLVRVLCPKCKARDLSAALLFKKLWEQEAAAGSPMPATEGLARGAGCPSCNMTGYQGRVGIFELLTLTDALRNLIIQYSSTELYRATVKAGLLRTMLLSGLEKASQGVTTVEEVLRVIGETED